MKIVGKIFAVLYTILFTFILFILVLVFTASTYLKGDFFTSLITSEVFMETKLTGLDFEFDGKEEIIELCGEDCTVEDAIVAAASEGFGIKEDLVREALNDKDIQEAIGDAISMVINVETTGMMEKIDYNDYKHLFKKDVVKEIMNELDLNENDVKKLIEEYNKSVDKFNKNGGMGGVQVVEHANTIN